MIRFVFMFLLFSTMNRFLELHLLQSRLWLHRLQMLIWVVDNTGCGDKE